jgi:NAD(P)-dependent dehydrogenase (short-subunit alcohol dehydrogenase family)
VLFLLLQITLGVNFFGPFYLTQLLLPLLKASAPSRTMWVSSPEETLGETDWEDIRCGMFCLECNWCRSWHTIASLGRAAVLKLSGICWQIKDLSSEDEALGEPKGLTLLCDL